MNSSGRSATSAYGPEEIAPCTHSIQGGNPVELEQQVQRMVRHRDDDVWFTPVRDVQRTNDVTFAD
ncbi:MAG: hypothetical protein ABI143_13810, partial [Caldimonas sp.]